MLENFDVDESMYDNVVCVCVFMFVLTSWGKLMVKVWFKLSFMSYCVCGMCAHIHCVAYAHQVLRNDYYTLQTESTKRRTALEGDVCDDNDDDDSDNDDDDDDDDDDADVYDLV
jgi:hypothetical protein